jgi:HKD family nuclease
MAEKEFILQGFTRRTHVVAVKRLFEIPNIKRVILSVAFVNEGGVTLIADVLKAVAGRVTIFAGIRNDITSSQGLAFLLGLGVKVFVVDTGSRHVLFHPKLYFVKSDEHARVVIGSANLTIGGLNNNIEAGVAIDLDLSNPADATLAKSIEDKLDAMPTEYPGHVIQLTKKSELEALLESGRLLDEAAADPPRPPTTAKNPSSDKISRIRLKVTPIRGIFRKAKASTPKSVTAASKPTRPLPHNITFELVWESTPLTRRALSIPASDSTNPTGSMLFTKGRMDNIDQRYYFRNEIFNAVNWQTDPNPSKKHWERGEANFRLVIKNIDYGIFRLRLSHNTDESSRTYEQRNSTTQIHWGETAKLLRHDDLLGRTMYLYRDKLHPSNFVIEID